MESTARPAVYAKVCTAAPLRKRVACMNLVVWRDRGVGSGVQSWKGLREVVNLRSGVRMSAVPARWQRSGFAVRNTRVRKVVQSLRLPPMNLSTHRLQISYRAFRWGGRAENITPDALPGGMKNKQKQEDGSQRLVGLGYTPMKSIACRGINPSKMAGSATSDR